MDEAQTFTEALAAIADVEGWLTEAQAKCLFDEAARVPAGGQIVEIGSFRGRSTIILAKSAPKDTKITAIDPHMGSDRGPREIAPNFELGDDDFKAFHANLQNAGVARRITHLRKSSTDAFGGVDGNIDLLYVDGAHRFAIAREDIMSWGGRVGDGGTMLVHDAFSSVGVTAALATTTFFSRSWLYCGRCGSLAKFQRVEGGQRLEGRQRIEGGQRIEGMKLATNAFRQILQLGWFGRNLMVKLALVLKLGWLARLLGHRTKDWPY